MNVTDNSLEAGPADDMELRPGPKERRALWFLRGAIVCETLFLFASVTAEFNLEHTLPEELRAYVTVQQEAPLSDAEAVGAVATFAVVGVETVALVGLWLRRRWARLPYVVSVVLSAFWLLQGGPEIMTNVGNFMAELAVLSSGFIAALIYFAPLPFHVPKTKALSGPAKPGPLWRRYLLATTVCVLGCVGVAAVFVLLYILVLQPESADAFQYSISTPWRAAIGFTLSFIAIHFSSFLVPHGSRQHSALISGLVFVLIPIVWTLVGVPSERWPRMVEPVLIDGARGFAAALLSSWIHARQWARARARVS